MLEEAQGQFDGEIRSASMINFLSAIETQKLPVLEFCLSKKPYLSSTFLYNSKRKDSLVNLQPKLKYEILKNTYTKYIINKEGEAKSLQEVETIIIFNFLDVLLHESSDNSTHFSRKRKFPWPVVESLPSKKIALTTNDGSFLEHSDTDITLVVGGYKLFMNSLVLTGSSPVFKAMLESNFKEGREKVIQLPGKNLFAMINFLTYLKNPGYKIGMCMFLTQPSVGFHSKSFRLP